MGEVSVDNIILLYQLATLLIGVVSGTMAFCLFLIEAAPLTRKFLVASQIFNAYYLLAGLAAYLIRVTGGFSPWVEAAFSLGNFWLFAGLVPTWTAFILELRQRPFSGGWKLVSTGLGVLGALFPIVVMALPLDEATRVLVLRYGLYGGFAPLILVYALVLSVAAQKNWAQGTDGWKLSTLRGTNLLVFCGFPLFLVDALWPWVQVSGGWLPRAFNLQGIFFAAFGLYYGFRWATLLRAMTSPKESARPYDAARVGLLDLTDRERQIFDLLFQDTPNQALAQALGISLGTVKNHVYHIFQKTGASSRRELIRMFQTSS